MNASSMLVSMLLCGVFGLLGQAIRIIVGMKKMRDNAAASGGTPTRLFEWNLIGISLLIGFTAGMLGYFTLDGDTDSFTKQTALTLMSFGYAGADFIEGLLLKKTPAPKQ